MTVLPAHEDKPAPARLAILRRLTGDGRSCAVVVLLVLTFFVFHAAVLRRCADGLIDERPLPRFDRVWVRSNEFRLDGEGAVDEAASLCRQDPMCGIVTVGVMPMPVVRAGVLPPSDVVIARAMEKRGIAPNRIAALSGEARDVCEEVRRLGEWLKEHRNSRVLLLCDRFGSARMGAVVERTLLPDEAARVGIRGLPRRGIDETNWWKTRNGVKAFLFAALDRTFQAIQGEDRLVNEPWDFEAYDKGLRQRAGEGRP